MLNLKFFLLHSVYNSRYLGILYFMVFEPERHIDTSSLWSMLLLAKATKEIIYHGNE
jgi:hypothetical protein